MSDKKGEIEKRKREEGRAGEKEGGREKVRERRERGEGERGGRKGGREGREKEKYNHYMFTFILSSYSKGISVALNETNVPV